MKQTLQFVLHHGYAILFISVLTEQIGIPLPSIPILLAMGALAGLGEFRYLPAVLIALLACLIADNIWYWLGVYRGASILNLLCKISLEPDSCVRQTENMFMKYGPRGLLFSKFVPGLSTAACPLAGMFRMKVWKFCLFDGAGALVWVVAYSGLGYVFRDQLEELAEKASGMGSWILALILTAAGGWILWKYIERRRFYRELRIARVDPDELLGLINSGTGVTILDLRNVLAWTGEGAAKLPGALHMSFEELEQRFSEIPLDQDIILYCT